MEYTVGEPSDPPRCRAAPAHASRNRSRGPPTEHSPPADRAVSSAASGMRGSGMRLNRAVEGNVGTVPGMGCTEAAYPGVAVLRLNGRKLASNA